MVVRVSDADDCGVDCGVEVTDCPGWVWLKFGVVVCGGVFEIMKNCGTWASVSDWFKPKSCTESSLKMVCSFTCMS